MKRVTVSRVRTVTLFCVSNKRFFLLSYDLGQIDGKRKSGEKPLLLVFLCSTIKLASYVQMVTCLQSYTKKEEKHHENVYRHR